MRPWVSVRRQLTADRFKMNIVNCALLGAFVLPMPERPDVERLTDFYDYPDGSG